MGLLVFLQILLIYASEISNNELVSVSVIFRHGERTINKHSYSNNRYKSGYYWPEGFKQLTKNVLRHGDKTILEDYPNDPYHSRYYWPEGYGQLTNKGKMQLFQLGQWFRDRYSNFLSEYYTNDDVYILSSNLDRAIMSAENFLAGLFPPVNEQVWNLHLRWQPIPVHTVPLELDNLFLNLKYCPKYNKLLQQFENTSEFLKMQADNQNLYDYLTVNMGHLIKDPISVAYLYDTLEIENDKGYTLPNWTKSVFPNKLKPLLDFKFIEPTSTTDMARFQVGPLLDKIVSQFENTTVSKKLTVYSGHDLTLVNVLNSLRLYEHERPPPGSALIFELLVDDGYFVNIFYKNGSIPHKLKLNGCEFDCPLDRFREIIQPLRLESDEWYRECFAIIDFSEIAAFPLTTIVSLIIGVLLLATAFVWYCQQRRNKKRRQYMNLVDLDA